MQEPIEVILAKQLAGHLSVPIVVHNVALDIVYYNEATERLTGYRFDETGRIPRDESRQMLRLSDAEDSLLPDDLRPVQRAVQMKAPVHAKFFVRAATWEGRRAFESTTVPLIGLAGEVVGAMVMLWEQRES